MTKLTEKEFNIVYHAIHDRIAELEEDIYNAGDDLDSIPEWRAEISAAYDALTKIREIKG